MWWHIVIGITASFAVLYVVLVIALWQAHKRNPQAATLHQALKLVPEIIRLLKRLALDPTLPKTVRIRLIVLGVYLASPIDLIPDFVPVLGYADDVIVMALVLRSVVRRAGPLAIERHWRGSEDGLRLVLRLAGCAPAA